MLHINYISIKKFLNKSLISNKQTYKVLLKLRISTDCELPNLGKSRLGWWWGCYTGQKYTVEAVQQYQWFFCYCYENIQRDSSTMATILIVILFPPLWRVWNVTMFETWVNRCQFPIYTNDTPLVYSGTWGSCHSLILLCAPRPAPASMDPSVIYQELQYLKE